MTAFTPLHDEMRTEDGLAPSRGLLIAALISILFWVAAIYVAWEWGIIAALELAVTLLALSVISVFTAIALCVVWTGKVPWEEEEIVNETGKDLCQKQQ